MKKLWIAIVKLFGWKFDLPPADDLKRLHHCVLIEAPHTSIYDFLLGAACVWRMGLNARFFIKKEFFVFPLRHFLKWSGALPIDRGNKNNHMVDKAVEAYGVRACDDPKGYSRAWYTDHREDYKARYEARKAHRIRS